MDLVTHAATGAVIGAAMAPDDTHRAPLMVAGAIAALLPDLDGLAGRAGAAAAWRYHRVTLHGVAAVPLLVLASYVAITGATRMGWISALPGAALLLVLTAAVLSHLLLDVLTSFGTALLYPFSRRRFSTHTHFIVDPLLLVCMVAGLAVGRPGTALAAAGVLIVAVAAWHAHLDGSVWRALAGVDLPDGVVTATVVPGPLSPFRWTVIARLEDGHGVVASMWRPGSISGEVKLVSNVVSGVALARAVEQPLVAAYLESVDFLHAEWVGPDDDRRALVIEDLKWRVQPGYRPLCVEVPWRGSRPLRAAAEKPMFWRGPRQTWARISRSLGLSGASKPRV